jgi:hypothetical protein
VIVSEREAKRIFEGRKRQHRLPLHRRAPEPGNLIPVTFRRPNEALGYDAYGHPREEPIRACHIRITERWETAVGKVTASDLVDEGFRDIDEYRDFWPNMSVHVWVIRFHVEQRDEARLLSARVVAGRQGSYVTNVARALPDEPEAVDPFTQQQFSDAARERDLQRELERRDLRNRLPFALRLRAAELEARRRHIDIRDELRAINRWSDPKAREKQLTRIVSKLDTPVAA